MYLSKLAAAGSFISALVIGAAAAWVAGGFVETPVAPQVTVIPAGDVDVTYRLYPLEDVTAVNVRARDLVGVWSGSWGHSQDACSIEITRIDGNKFYGTLREGRAEIAISGTFDADGRRIFFHETKVITLGDYSEWSLGTNTGTFSADGRTLSGSGIDRWGVYKWGASK